MSVKCNKFENFIVRGDGAIRQFNPGINGILISYVEDYDEMTGRPVLRPAVSTLCVDMSLSDELTKAARELLKHVHNLSLPPAASPPVMKEEGR